MVDGDDTYPAEFAQEMADKGTWRERQTWLLETDFHLPILRRISGRFIILEIHWFERAINILFKNDIKDIMTGYRAFSYHFVKTFPVLSRGFEIETEMSIHASDKNMFMENVVIEYRDRPEGTESKLNTYSDGIKVLFTIAGLFRNYKPMASFGLISLILAVLWNSFS